MAIRQVTPAEAHNLLSEGYRYLDVRTEAEFSGGHPSTAVNIPVVFVDPNTQRMVPNPDFVAAVESRFSQEAHLVVGCQSGTRSQRAAELLAQAGFTRIVNMQGGFGGMRDQTGQVVVTGWKDSGLPLCQDCPADHAYPGVGTRPR